RQIERKHARQCVPKASIREKSNVVLEVGSKTTDDKSRKDEPRPAKRQSGSGVNKSEWHCSNYDAFPAQPQPTEESHRDSPAAVSRPVMFRRDAHIPGLNRDMLCLGACLIAGIRLAIRGLLQAFGR